MFDMFLIFKIIKCCMLPVMEQPSICKMQKWKVTKISFLIKNKFFNDIITCHEMFLEFRIHYIRKDYLSIVLFIRPEQNCCCISLILCYLCISENVKGERQIVTFNLLTSAKWQFHHFGSKPIRVVTKLNDTNITASVVAVILSGRYFQCPSF